MPSLSPEKSEKRLAPAWVRTRPAAPPQVDEKAHAGMLRSAPAGAAPSPHAVFHSDMHRGFSRS